MRPHLRLQHLCHGLGELRRVTPGHQKAVFAVLRHEPGPAPQRVRGDHRAADAHRLGQYLREPVLVGGMHQRPCVGRVLQHVIDPPGCLGLAAEPEPPDLLVGDGSIRSLAHDQQPGVVALAELGERVDEQVHPLDAQHVPDVHEHRWLAWLQPRMRSRTDGSGELGDGIGHERRRRWLQSARLDGVIPYGWGGSDQAVGEAVDAFSHPLVVAPVQLVTELDELVLGDNDLSPPARRPGHPGRRQAHEVSVDLTRDQDVRLLRPEVTDQARYRTGHPLDTQTVNADLRRKPRRRRVVAVTHDGRLGLAGLDEAESEPTDHVGVRPLAGAVD